jgi:hypothetical protein
MMFNARTALVPVLLALGLGGAAPVDVAVSVNGKKLQARGTGDCKHAPMAAIYGVRSAMWRVEFEGDAKSAVSFVNLTMWHPLNGKAADQMSLSINTRKGDYRIGTVKGAKQEGSGTIAFHKAGAGGRFVIKGKAANGASIDATFTCERLNSLEAVGG